VFSKILVVCVGNICRSPMAACLLKERLADKGITVTSAGVGALVDQPMDPFAEAVLSAHGFDYSEHRAQQLHRTHLHDADIILVAEKKLIEPVLKIGPDARGKVFTLGKWQSDRDIPDPYRQSRSVFEHTYVLIDEAVTAWVKHLT
jgi:protein-tyrosine phosphatase